MCRAIIDIGIRLHRIEGEWKMSQNRSPEDRTGVIDGLRARRRIVELEMVDLADIGPATLTVDAGRPNRQHPLHTDVQLSRR
jgi:hypothetical protein